MEDEIKKDEFEIYCPKCKSETYFTRLREWRGTYRCNECELLVLECYAHNRHFQSSLRRRNERNERKN